MKKLLALVMVLGLAAVANAGYVIDIAGAPAEPLAPGTYDVSIIADAGLVGGEISLGVAGGTLDLTNMQISTQYITAWFDVNGDGEVDPGDFLNYGAWDFAWGIKAGTTPGPLGVTIDGGNFSAATGYDEVMLSGIGLTVLGDGALTVGGLINGEAAAGDSVAFTPEPMTMTLLGIGGLALIRRRRA